MSRFVHQDTRAEHLIDVKKFILKFTILSGMLLGLPMAGVFLIGLPVSRYLAFPPETRYVTQAPFSWGAFAIFLLIIFSGAFPLLQNIKWATQTAANNACRFPWWGRMGCVSGVFAWILAWCRFAWFAPFQPHTFTPLWVSYVLVINGLSFRRKGRCLLTNRTGYFLFLFPMSAVFWWFFEYLNRFVQNWYYVGAHFGPWEYFWYATLPFSTVLPAVLSTQEWIADLFYLKNTSELFRTPAFFRTRRFTQLIFTLSGTGLLAIGIWPDCLFPLLWVSPLLIIISLQSLMKEPHIFSNTDTENWHPIVSAALAALLCGFFWEMWNYYSLAKWEYSVPFVHRFQIFEMPILGYAGYLPFGLECLVIGQMIEAMLKTRVSGVSPAAGL